MCGIAGIIRQNYKESDVVAIRAMAQCLAHRGPDDEGFHSVGGVHFAHRRLAIIDPQNGRQPMCSRDGALTLIFNGAIYNYLELRQELIARGHSFQTYSDTEVLLHMYEEFGENCLNRLNGMFAFAVLDERTNEVFMARDRFGIKPFYYIMSDGAFLFASEPKAFWATGYAHAEPDMEGLRDYITFQFCLGAKTMFSGVKKLEPGHAMKIGVSDNLAIKEWCWWDLTFSDDTYHTEEYFIDKLQFLVSDAIKLRMRADVPVGSYLSGGLDSSTVATVASDFLSGAGLHTFTGTFSEGAQFDESHYASLVAHQAHTAHHELVITAQDFLESIESIVYHMDEPGAGPGVFPQFCVARMAHEHVKVVLGGQGGDEIFIGYARYLVAYLEEVLRGGIFQTFDETKHAVSMESIIPNLPMLKQYVPMMRTFWKSGLFDSLEKRYFAMVDRSEGSAAMFSQDLFSGQSYCPSESFAKIFMHQEKTSYINRMCYFDCKGSLPALLQVDDRTGMAFGLESRLPLLDYRIAEFCAAVPPGIKFKGGQPKALFRQAIRSLLPHEVLNRKDKMGFPVPLNIWYCGELREWVRCVLLSERAKSRGIYDAKVVEALLAKDQGFSRVLWGLLCLELWFTRFIDK